MGSRDVSSERTSTLIKGLSVLEFVSAHPFGCTIAETAKGVEISRAAARRFLLTFCDIDILRQDQKWFLPTPKLAELATSPIVTERFWQALLPPMKHVSEKTGEACSMSTLYGQDIVYVARAPSRRVLSVHLEVGSRLPAVHTSMGRVLLANLVPEKLTALIKQTELPRRTRFSLSDRQVLLETLFGVASNGYAIVDQELEEDLISVAVPVLAPTGATLAALNFSSTPTRYPSKRLRDTIVPMLEAASKQITSVLRTNQSINSHANMENTQ